MLKKRRRSGTNTTLVNKININDAYVKNNATAGCVRITTQRLNIIAKL